MSNNKNNLPKENPRDLEGLGGKYNPSRPHRNYTPLTKEDIHNHPKPRLIDRFNGWF